MKTGQHQVVVVGGGATGTGILRDLAMRGIDAILVEQGDLAHGTSSRFHGLLHSGARYAVRDREAARECLEENMILRRIAPGFIEDTGGVFALGPGDDPSYCGRWLEACREAGIPAVEIDPRELARANPALSPDIARAFKVPDGSVDGFRVIRGNVASAVRHGATCLTYSKVTAVHSSNGSITGVEINDRLTGELCLIRCPILVNAAGPWAEEIAAMAGVELKIIKDKGTLVAFNHRLTANVVNRLRPPGDGDIFVPHDTVTIFGTTSEPVDSPGHNRPFRSEVQKLLQEGERLVPGIEKYRLIRSFAGVRPLYQAGRTTDARSVSRNFALLDHGAIDGLSGFITIVGGKFSTFRLMAEKTADLVAAMLGTKAPCHTAAEPISAPVREEMVKRGFKVFGVPGSYRAAGRLEGQFKDVLEQARHDPGKGSMLCQCELVSLAEIEHAARMPDSHNLGDIRRKTRMGMGTCQGTFCSYRTLGALSETAKFSSHPREHLDNFLQKRWKGIRPILWGQQLREASLSIGIYCSLFGLERMK
ncbi:MAG: anaerobic glycerol-3-phosphate dehydrogenase subunit GlpA [Bacillota bacterium]